MKKALFAVFVMTMLAMAGCKMNSNGTGGSTSPYFKSKAPNTSIELVEVVYNISVGDDQDPPSALRITKNSKDSCMGELVDNGNGTGTYTFASPQRSAGTTCVIGLTVTDSSGKTARQNSVVNIFSRALPPSMVPPPGQAMAGQITDENVGFYGDDALGMAGDYILMNNKAAFVIEGLKNIRSYYYYGGILIDAVALEGGLQAGPDQLEELDFIVGRFSPSIALRALRGEDIVVINDGSDGNAAQIRVYMSDDVFWLVELELISMMGTGRSTQLGLVYWVDYILKPDVPILQAKINIYNPGENDVQVISGGAGFFGDTTRLKYPYMGSVTVEGISINSEIAWLTAASINGDLSYGVQIIGDMATVNISGVQAILDSTTLVGGTPLAPGDTQQQWWLFSVGTSDAHSGLKPLMDVNPQPRPGMSFTQNDINGNVTDADTAVPLEGVEVEVQHRETGGNWTFLDSYLTDASGNFSGTVPELTLSGSTFEYRIVCHLDGYQDSTPLALDPSSATGLNLTMEQEGILSYDITNPALMNIPARIDLYRTSDNGLEETIYTVAGVGQERVQPGDYNVSVTHGFEYTTYWDGPITIVKGTTTNLAATLERVVDTTGFLSVDTHMHAGFSPDNYITIPNRIKTVAALGLEVAVSTDHEFVSSWWNGIYTTNAQDWVATVIGQEVTAGSPGHSNIYPIVPHYNWDGRGGIVRWWEPDGDKRAYYPMDIPQIFAAERARGAQVVQVNHPRDTGMANYSDYNPLTGLSDGDPLAIGLAPYAELLSANLDFDAYELMNDPDPVFYDAGASDPTKTGNFEDWMSFLNFGHKVTAVGVSDCHNYGDCGYPRNYFESSSDYPNEFDQDEFVDSMLNGRVVVSTGAFARVGITDVSPMATMGDTITDLDGNFNLWVHIEALPEINVESFKVFVNCDEAVNVDIPVDQQDDLVKYDGTLPITVPLTSDAHVVVMGFGNNYLPLGLRQFDPAGVPRFATNAIYIDTDGTGAYDNFPGGKTCTYTAP